MTRGSSVNIAPILASFVHAQEGIIRLTLILFASSLYIINKQHQIKALALNLCQLPHQTGHVQLVWLSQVFGVWFINMIPLEMFSKVVTLNTSRNINSRIFPSPSRGISKTIGVCSQVMSFLLTSSSISLVICSVRVFCGDYTFGKYLLGTSNFKWNIILTWKYKISAKIT